MTVGSGPDAGEVDHRRRFFHLLATRPHRVPLMAVSEHGAELPAGVLTAFSGWPSRCQAMTLRACARTYRSADPAEKKAACGVIRILGCVRIRASIAGVPGR